jgi:DNA-binding transcriptional MerR regulator
MYRIGEFARITDVSAKTLRFYDEIGLLRPASTDPMTRYRYYAAEQLGELAAIIALKDLGLSLAEVSALSRRASRASRRTALERARTRLERAMTRTRAALAGIDAALAGPAGPDDLPVVVKRRPTTRIASLGAVTAGYDDVALAEAELLGRVPPLVRGRLRGILWHQCADAGVPSGEPFVELHARQCPDGCLDVKELPSVTVACAYAVDDYDAAEHAYRAIRVWMARQRCELTGPKRELYHGRMLEIQFPFAWRA